MLHAHLCCIPCQSIYTATVAIKQLGGRQQRAFHLFCVPPQAHMRLPMSPTPNSPGELKAITAAVKGGDVLLQFM